MAKSIVSPGVFVQEIDQSFLGPGVGSIGCALIGRAPQGPAFVPVTVSTYNEFTSYFGDLNQDYLLPYAARAYLKNSATANIIRVLGPSGRTVNGAAVTPGYAADSIWSIDAITGSTGVVMATVEVSGSGATLTVTDLGNDLFFVNISSGSNTYLASSASFLSQSSLYVKNVLNTDPTAYNQFGYYLREVYDYALKTTVGGNATYTSGTHAVVTNFNFGFNSGSTPWIKSQLFGGTTEYNLIKIHTIGHGVAENGRFKVSINNVRVSPAPLVNPFGKFDLEIRDFGDTDQNTSIVEAFTNLSFDPTDPNYIMSTVGDKFFTFDNTRGKIVEHGNYDNNSKLIRIELCTASFPNSALPWGYRGLVKPDLTISGSGAGVVKSGILALPLVADLKDKETQSEAQSYVYWGLETVLSGNVTGRFSLYSAMTGSDADFSLANISGSTLSTLAYTVGNAAAQQKAPGDTTSALTLETNLAKFTVPVAFGYDGFDVRLADPLQNETQLVGVSQLGTQALRQAVDVIANPDFIDLNMLGIPGVYASTVTKYALTNMTNRADVFYVMDVSGTTVSSVIQNVRGLGIDSNYAGCYYPSIRVRDDVNGGVITLPASIPALGCIAYNDRVSYPWFAPAGLNRAGLSMTTIGFNVSAITDQLDSDERDNLYENRINPIARFPDVPQGVIWGQKTLQLASSALDRINVRRLLLKAEKLIASAVKFLVFEQNDSATQTRFRQLVNPILTDIQQKSGIDTFKVVCDSTNNTPDIIDRNQMIGQIFLVPTKTAEFIIVPFTISKSGATFDNG
jgi:hypothetical protein